MLSTINAEIDGRDHRQLRLDMKPGEKLLIAQYELKRPLALAHL